MQRRKRFKETRVKATGMFHNKPKELEELLKTSEELYYKHNIYDTCI